jgi:hypothetical protein
MKKLFLLPILALLLAFNTAVKADEGMWIPMLVERLNYEDMQRLGLKLTAEEIYSINNSSLKDAIVQFGRGCTGEIISGQGLLLTNHHCGYGRIQAHSTVEHDYLKDGFWAMSLEEELPNPGLTARFLVRMEDVTPQVMAQLTADMTENERNAKIGEISSVLSKEASEGTHYDCNVRSFFGGSEFYLFVYEIFRDVRLVGAPPSSIGNFGDDTDNWMWPRHTGDFAMLRIYTAPDGSPAEYAKDNIPLKPRHYLPISLKGVQKDDYAMIRGYPGSTERYRTSHGMELAIEQNNPPIVDALDEIQEKLRYHTDADDATRIKYASKDASMANDWKYYIGQTKGLKNLKVKTQKQEIEHEFTEWVNADADPKMRYGNVLENTAAGYHLMNGMLTHIINMP